MSEPDDFREFLARQAEAEAAIVHGDPQPRMELWSRQNPVSLLGAWGPNTSGEELSRLFRWVASRLSQATYSDFRWDIEVAEASGEAQRSRSCRENSGCMGGSAT